MMIDSKLVIPFTRSGHISRPRLHDRLTQGLNRRLTLLTAPPGYGKTTLLGEWLYSTGMTAAWITLDAEDNYSGSFWRHTAASLAKVSHGFEVQAALEFAEQVASGSAVAIMLNALNRIPETKVLVLDDFHHLTDQVLLTEIIRFIRFIPEHIHVYIASRIYPALQLSKIRAAGELIEIPMEELRFSRNEARSFFKLSSDLDISDQQLNTLYAKTEGWITGMRLAAISLSHNPDHGKAVKELSGRNRGFIDYFHDEIMSCVDPRLQRFLYRSSILTEMNGELCEAITGFDDSPALLRRLEQMNLFIAAQDSRQEWYRYHQLFRQYLQLQLKMHEPRQVHKLHLSAGQWMEASSRYSEAMEHYFSAEAYEFVTSLLEKAYASQKQNKAELRRWLYRVPAHALFAKPQLYMLQIASFFFEGQMEEAGFRMTMLSRRLAGSDEDLTKEARDIYQTGLMGLLALRAYVDKDFITSIHYWERYIRLDPEEKLFANADLSMDGIRPVREVHMHVGSLKTAEILLKRYLEACSQPPRGTITIELIISFSNLMYEWNQLDKAEQYAKQALESSEIIGNVNARIRASLILARISAARDDEKKITRVHEDMQRMQHQLQRTGYSLLAKTVEMYLAGYWLTQNNLKKAEEWLLTSQLQITDEIVPAFIWDYQVFAVLLAAQGRNGEAVELARRISEKAREEGLYVEAIRSMALQSLLYAKDGDRLQSLNLIEEALVLAECEGYIRTFLDFGSPMIELLKEYLHSRQSNHREVIHKVSLLYVKRLLQHASAGQLHSAPKEKAEEGVEEQRNAKLLTAKELDVLRQIHEGMSNKQIADYMRISLSTVKTHVNNLYKKLGVSNRVLAVEQAKRQGVIW